MGVGYSTAAAPSILFREASLLSRPPFQPYFAAVIVVLYCTPSSGYSLFNFRLLFSYSLLVFFYFEHYYSRGRKRCRKPMAETRIPYSSTAPCGERTISYHVDSPNQARRRRQERTTFARKRRSVQHNLGTSRSYSNTYEY